MIRSKYEFRNNVGLYKSFFSKKVRLAFFIGCLICLAIPSWSQQVRSISEIQGEQSFSPYVGETVRIPTAVITYIEGNSMIVQSPIEDEDQNDNTSEAILINGTVPSWAEIGQTVEITGRVSEWSNATLIEDPGLSFTLVNSSQLIGLHQLDERIDEIDFSDLEDLEALEWMSFSFLEAKVCGPTFGNSNWLYVYFGDERPAREAGIPAPGITGLPEFDNNLEAFQFLQSGSSLEPLTANSRIAGTGILIPDDERFQLLGLSYQAELADIYQPIAAPTDQLSIASANLLRFDRDDGAFQLRLPKMVRYLIEGLGKPDIIGVQEVADLKTLQALAEALNQELQGEEHYTAYLEQGNNGTFINSGFLVGQRIQVEDVRALGRSQSLSLGGSLHDRPPYLLEGFTKTIPRIPFKVLNLHLRSLSGIEGNNATFVRTKRNEQAISVAQMVQSFQNDNLILLGDFNAYPFSDGFVDIFHQIQGEASEGAIFAPEIIVNPPMQISTADYDLSESYSFVFQGNTQQIDHILYTSLTDLECTSAAIYKGNADAPDDWENDFSRIERASDHDGLAAYFEVAYPWGDIIIEDPVNRPSVETANPYVPGAPLRFYPDKGDFYTVQIFDLAGRKIKALQTPFIDNDDIWEMPDFQYFGEGLFIIQILGTDFSWTAPIVFGIN